MTPRQFYYSKNKDVVRSVAKGAETTFFNFKQIAVAGGSVSKCLAARLAQSSNNEMTELEILYPERYDTSAA
ncbi:hypothetical protein [Marinagarivorans algicola]|uniref:hypothetical protein n=1 Tax=Marinagarivorans algicola TaxID=1513270 RepID=UPI0037370C5A